MAYKLLDPDVVFEALADGRVRVVRGGNGRLLFEAVES